MATHMTKPPRPRAEVERVAKAIHQAGLPVISWRADTAFNRDWCRQAACAAIRAMSPPRKPRAKRKGKAR